MQQKGQVTLFIIIAILLVAAALFSYFFIFQRPLTIPLKARPVETYLADCVNEQIKEASRIAGLQGGYIELPEFEPGSEYMPFSSRLNFLGIEVPYWWYISGNNIVRTQRPSLRDIERQFENYLKSNIEECSFESFVKQGYDIEKIGEPEIVVSIRPTVIETTIRWPFVITYSDEVIRIDEHKISTDSNFGSLYNTASLIFEAEQEKLFLENYALDVLRLYAPVTGIELSCAPKVWRREEVANEVNSALEGNIGTIKISGTYYKLARPESRYFEVDVGRKISEQVSFLYSRNMPHVFEVWPTEDGTMKAEPIGNQPGLRMLGALGFCYVPYHFVYDLKFPVLVQVSKNGELFQFPVLVIIDKNSIRNVTEAETVKVVFDLCEHRTQQVTIFSYDESNRPIEADIGYKCFNQICDLGRTKIDGNKAFLETWVPQCYNGFIVSKAKGYATTKTLAPSIGPFIVNVFLKPEHQLDLEVGGLVSGEHAIINFISDDYSVSVYYPEQKQVALVEGNYNVSVYLFKEAPITLEAQRVEKCIELPVAGIKGIFGATQEQCFEMDIPRDTLTNVVYGGGSTRFPVTEVELARASKVRINAQAYDVPKNLLELGDVYELIDASEIQISLV